MSPALPPAVLSAIHDEPTAPLFVEVDPVLVVIIAILLLIVFAFFLLIRRTLLSFSEGVRRGRQ